MRYALTEPKALCPPDPARIPCIRVKLEYFETVTCKCHGVHFISPGWSE